MEPKKLSEVSPVLLQTEQIYKTFKSLLPDTTGIDIMSAWMTDNPFWEEIRKAKDINKENLRLVIGIDGNVTDPEILKEAEKRSELRVQSNQKGGTFHPKLYIFHLKNGKKKVFVGSANFTGPAMDKNDEILVMLSGDAKDFEDFFEETFENSYPLSEELLELLVEAWNSQEQSFSDAEYQGSALGFIPLGLSWKEFYREIMARLDRHPEVLDGFLEYPELIQKGIKISKDDARKIYGQNPPYDYIGSLRGAGYVRNYLLEMTDEGKKIMKILQKFQKEDLKQKNPAKTVCRYLGQLVDISGVGVPVATRLLTITRPDLAVSYNSASEVRLNKFAGLRGTITDKNYKKKYGLLLETIYNQAWYKAPEPKNAKERDVWLRRVALLDLFAYDKIPENMEGIEE